MKHKRIVLHGRVTKVSDYNEGAVLADFPVKPRIQLIEILLEEEFYRLLELKDKRVEIIVDDGND